MDTPPFPSTPPTQRTNSNHNSALYLFTLPRRPAAAGAPAAPAAPPSGRARGRGPVVFVFLNANHIDDASAIDFTTNSLPRPPRASARHVAQTKPYTTNEHKPHPPPTYLRRPESQQNAPKLPHPRPAATPTGVAPAPAAAVVGRREQEPAVVAAAAAALGQRWWGGGGGSWY